MASPVTVWRNEGCRRGRSDKTRDILGTSSGHPRYLAPKPPDRRLRELWSVQHHQSDVVSRANGMAAGAIPA
jgi:hypothetical protein